jgi:predicted dehydrogenase
MRGFGFAILGTGMISKDMRTALMRADNTVTLAAVGSRSLETAKEFAAHFKKDGFDKPQAFGSYKEAIECAATKAVYVAVPTGLEEDVVLQCIAAGKHVLADKPFLSAASVARMTKAAADKGLLFMDATHFVHSARTALIRDKLAKGVIGEVQSMTANFFAGTGLLETQNIRFDPKLEPMGAVGDLGWVRENERQRCICDCF